MARKLPRRRPNARPNFLRLEDRVTPADMFMGGVRVATADLSGDGITDIIGAAGPGGGPHVRVLSGANGSELLSFMAYDANFRGGVFVAAGDINGDGTQDIVTGAGEGGSAHVRIFNGRTGALQNEFQAFDASFKGGVRVAVGDVTGDGRADIICGSGAGDSGLVRVFSGTTLTQTSELTPFDARYTRGVFVGSGDTNGDGRDDIIVGAGRGGTPQVKVFSGTDNSVLRDFIAFDRAWAGGVSVSALTRADGSREDIMVGAGAGGVPLVGIYDGSTGTLTRTFFAYAQGFTGGVWVANANLQQKSDIVTGAGFGGGPHVLGWNGLNSTIVANFYAFAPVFGPFAAFADSMDDTPETPDTTAPTVTISTQAPTAPVAVNQTIQGTATDNKAVIGLTATVDGGAPQAVIVAANGTFSFTTALSLSGGADGSHTVVFRATDAAGNTSTPQNFTFVLQTQTPELTLELAPENDGAVLGNRRTNDASVRLTGTAAGGATVTLVGTTFTTTADGQGNYSFNSVPLSLGVNSFTARAQVEGQAPSEITRLIVRNSDPQVADPVENFSVAVNAEATILNLPAIFSDIDVNSLVHFVTNSGEFDLELFDQQTPLTVKNFLAYVTSGRYADTIFHRSVANFVIQGGGFKYIGNPARLDTVTTDPAVQNEPILSNQLGTVAMAKLGGDPNSATSQFFFNLKDNSRTGAALDSQNGGFTAFGQLRGTGLSVINELAAIPVQNRNGVFSEIPLQDYPAPPAGNFPGDTTPDNYAFINSVSVVRDVDDRNGDALTFSVVSNSNPNLVTAELVNGRVNLKYTAGQNGRATITLRATDTEGRSADTTFTVRVGTAPDDEVAPTILLSDPASGQTTRTNVTIQGEASDEQSGLFSVSVSIDGGTRQNVSFDSSTGAFSFPTNFAVNGSQDGEHTLVFTARDIAGNESTQTFTMTLDTTAPTLEITTPETGDIILGNVTIEGTSSDALSGLDIVAVSIDGAAAVNATLGANNTFTFQTNFELDGSDNGEHVFSFSARDLAGNLSGPVTLRLTLETLEGDGSLTLDLDAQSDSFGGGIAGNHRTIRDTVTLQGTANAGATVILVGTELTTLADNQGKYSFANVPLTLGVNTFTARATLGTNVENFTRRIIRDSEPTLASPIANFTVRADGATTTFNLPTIFSDADVNTLVRFTTSAGAFDVELFDQFAPNTVANFLGYLPRYQNTIFHRNTGRVLQGGQFQFNVDNGESSLIPIGADPVRANEPGLSNQEGTLVMAPAQSNAANQQNQFFFNLENNSGGVLNLDTANGGTSVFGTLRGNGAQVIGDLTGIPVQDRSGDFSQIPLRNYPNPPAGNFQSDLSSSNLALINGVSIVRSVDGQNGDALTYAIGANSNPNVVAATIVGGRLVLNYPGDRAGQATIVVRATDAEGQFIEASFTVTVS